MSVGHYFFDGISFSEPACLLGCQVKPFATFFERQYTLPVLLLDFVSTHVPEKGIILIISAFNRLRVSEISCRVGISSSF